MINWRVYKDKTVACLLNQEELPGFFSKSFTAGPSEAAIVIRDGKIENIYTQTRVQTAGFMDRVLTFFKNESRVEVLFMSLSCFNLLFHIKSTAADMEEIECECNMSLKTIPENAGSILELMADKNLLAIDDVYEKIKHEITAKGFSNLVSQHQSQDILGSADISLQIENNVKENIKGLLANWGLVFESMSVNWCKTKQMKADIAVKEADRKEKAKDFENKRHLMEMQRQLAISKTRIANLYEIKNLEAKGDTQLKAFYLEAELGRDRLQDQARVDTAEIDAKIQLINAQADHQEDLLGIETRKVNEMTRLDVEDREWRLKQEAKTAARKDEDQEMWEMVRMQIEMATAKHERKTSARRQEIQAQFDKQQAQIDAQYRERRTKLEESLARMGMQERIMTQAFNSGTANPDALKVLLKEQTKQDYATTSDDKVKAMFEADGKKSNMDTYKNAEDRERSHQIDMTRLSTEMMQGAKQTPSQTIVTGTRNICSKCSFELEQNWKICPACGEPLGLPSCKNCGKKLQLKWELCPYCGTKK